MNEIIEETTELIKMIPYIIESIAYGYIFISVYEWITFKDTDDRKYMILKSIVANLIIVSIYGLISNWLHLGDIHSLINRVVLSLISGIMGLLIGKIITHKCFNDFLCKIHIERTTNANIWDDVIEPYTWVRVFMKDGTSYLGQYKYGEPFKSEPIIVLATYQKLNKDSDIVIDYSKDNNEFIMINTKDFDRIEITHRTK